MDGFYNSTYSPEAQARDKLVSLANLWSQGGNRGRAQVMIQLENITYQGWPRDDCFALESD
jgi:hypothetical protein